METGIDFVSYRFITGTLLSICGAIALLYLKNIFSQLKDTYTIGYLFIIVNITNDNN